MAEAAVAVASEDRSATASTKTPGNEPGSGLAHPVTELRVSAHLMTLDRGLFCLLRQPGGAQDLNGTGLPGVRVSCPPNETADAVSIVTFRSDGWLGSSDGAALIRIAAPRAQILVTIYQMAGSRPDSAPRIQVLRLASDSAASAPAASLSVPEAPPAGTSPMPQVVAHIQKTGDVGQDFGTWLGAKGSKLWIEGFGISPPDGLEPEDIEYQAVLGKGWTSPWVTAGKFCGSRGMALPLLGFRVRLSEKASRSHTVTYSATFTDGTEVGPVSDGEPCDSVNLTPLEALNISVEKKPAKAPVRASTPQRRAR